MSTFKKFYGKNIGVKFFPSAGEGGEPIIHLEPKKGLNKNDLRAIKEKLETILSVSESNFIKQNGQPIFTIQLDANSQPSQVEELLRTMFHGGSPVSNAMDLNDDPQEEPKQDVITPEPQPNPQQQTMPQESFISSAYEILHESTYRTGEYWEIISKASGKSKQAINDSTVLSLRKTYSRKPKGKRRDEVLRSLDKAMRYFVRKIRREQTPQSAEQYKQKYTSIDDLVPTDYAKGAPSEPEQGIGNAFEPGQSEQDSQPMNIDISDLFDSDDEEEEYEKFQVEE